MKPEVTGPLRLIASFWLQTAADCTVAVANTTAHSLALFAAMVRPSFQQRMPSWLCEGRQVREPKPGDKEV